MYTVIGTIKSRTFRVLWMLEELGEAYELIAEGPRSEAATAHNPTGKVPVLLADDTAIPDSTAILTYLSDKHRALTHKPGTLDRARQDAWSFRILDELDGLLWTAAKHSFVYPPEYRVPAVKDSLRWEFDRASRAIGAALTGPHVMGDALTVPDLILTHCLTWATNAKMGLTDQTLIDYRDRMIDRAAYKRVLAR